MIFGIADRGQDISNESIPANSFYRRTGEHRAEPLVVQGRQFLQARRVEGFSADQLVMRGRLSELVPGADRKTVITPVYSIADRLAELQGDRPLVFDGQVRNAARGVELVRGGECLGWTNIEAT